ncbi:MAG TPA: cation transporter [Thermoflexia bacterium]|nr:cation transporter [Thermoflexia bacterium]
MGHHHGHVHQENQQEFKIAFFLNLGFAILEFAGGLWTNSLAITSDALHDLGDSLALGLAWYLEGYSQRENDGRYSYGYRRFSLLGALFSALILVGGAFLVLSQAIPRLLHPEPSNAPGMALFAVGGILANGIAALRVSRGDGLNARMATWHLLEDVLGWAAVLVISVIMLFKELPILDPLLSILITLYVFYNVLGNLRQTMALFLQAVPEDVNLPQLEADLLALADIIGLHHTHIWSLDGEHHVFSTHLVLRADATKATTLAVKCQAKELIQKLDFEHITLEIDYADESCSLAA